VSDVDDVKSEADAAAAAAAEAASRLGLSGPPVLLRSGANHVFRVGDGVVRVTAGNVDVRAHVALIRWLAAEGLPVPTPIADPLTINGFHVTAWEYVDTHRPIDYRQLGVAIGTLHGLAGTGAVVLLLIAALPTQLEAAAALAIFAPMAAVSMALATSVFAWVLTRPMVEPVYRTVLIPALGLFGLLFGGWYTGLI